MENVLVWLQNARYAHHRWMMRYLQNRGWVVFYLEDEFRSCESDDFCWLNLYQYLQKQGC